MNPEFEGWYAREFPRVRAALALAVGDAGLAEEATAEAFARALASWPKVSRADSPTAWRAVAALPPRARTAVALRYVADLTEAEVAAAMNIARGTVAATLHVARKRLAEALTPNPLTPNPLTPNPLTPNPLTPDPLPDTLAPDTERTGR